MSNILTRVLGSENLTARTGIGNEEVLNDFDAKYPYSGMERIVDENGEQWIRIPKFYSYYETDNSGNVTGRQLSQYKVDKDTWFLNPAFLDDSGNEIAYIDVAAYLCSTEGNIVVTKNGISPVNGNTVTTTTMIRRAGNRNVGQSDYKYQLMDIWVWQLLQDLFTVEFANSDCNAIMAGYSTSRGRLDNGTCDAVVANSGKLYGNGDQCGMKYRGIENLYGNGRMFIDGIRYTNNKIWLSTDNSNYFNTGINKVINNGTASILKYNETNHIALPDVIIQTSTQQTGAYTDFYNGESNSGTTVLYSNGGLFAYHTNDTIEQQNANNAYRLVRKPLI